MCQGCKWQKSPHPVTTHGCDRKAAFIIAHGSCLQDLFHFLLVATMGITMTRVTHLRPYYARLLTGVRSDGEQASATVRVNNGSGPLDLGVGGVPCCALALLQVQESPSPSLTPYTGPPNPAIAGNYKTDRETDIAGRVTCKVCHHPNPTTQTMRVQTKGSPAVFYECKRDGCAGSTNRKNKRVNAVTRVTANGLHTWWTPDTPSPLSHT